MTAHFILYVLDQNASTVFYSATLGQPPRLDVPGMTEFELANRCVLGLMPVSGIRRLLGDALPDPRLAQGIPRSELYLLHPEAHECHRRAIQAGAIELSPMQARDWGDVAGYCLDPDGHVLAFATPIP